MKRLCKAFAAALCICLMLCSQVFAAVPNANIVSPVANSIVESDDLSVYVKVLNKKKLCVSVFEEMELIGTKVSEGIEEEILRSIDVLNFTEDMLKLIANEFFENKSIEFGTGESKHVLRQVMIDCKSSFTPKNSISYFTKTIENLKPGLYMIQLDVLGDDSKVEESYSSFIALKEKASESESKEEVPVESKTSLVQVLSDLLKSLIQ